MTTDRRGRCRRSTRALVAALAVTLLGAACGADRPDAEPSLPPVTEFGPSPATDAADRAPSAPDSVPSRDADPIGTQPSPADSSDSPDDPDDDPPLVDAPDGVSVRVELGYPRDLLERGRVNVITTNHSDADLLVAARELVVDSFTSPGPEVRPSTVPAGRDRMALQTLFGDVETCSDEPVVAEFVITYATSDDPTFRRSSLPIVDTGILDGIRAQTCTARDVLDAVDIAFVGVAVDGESFSADAVLTRTGGTDTFEVTAIVGTVLFGAESLEPGDVTPRILPAGQKTLVIPMTFGVNRCDSHAVAETTKKYGVDFWVAVDDAEPQRVTVPIDDLLDEFETILERCKTRTGGN